MTNIVGRAIPAELDQADQLVEPDPTILELTILSQTATKFKVGWVPPVGCVGYHMFVDHNRVSTTGLGSLNQTTFGKLTTPGPHTYEVRSLTYLATGQVVI